MAKQDDDIWYDQYLLSCSVPFCRDETAVLFIMYVVHCLTFFAVVDVVNVGCSIAECGVTITVTCSSPRTLQCRLGLLAVGSVPHCWPVAWQQFQQSGHCSAAGDWRNQHCLPPVPDCHWWVLSTVGDANHVSHCNSVTHTWSRSLCEPWLAGCAIVYWKVIADCGRIHFLTLARRSLSGPHNFSTTNRLLPTINVTLFMPGSTSLPLPSNSS